MRVNNSKNILSALFLLCFFTIGTKNAIAQSVSASKIYEFLESQNPKQILKDITAKGFKYKSDLLMSDYGFNAKAYQKNASLGTEYFTVGNNDELFIIIYRPILKAYSGYKEKLLTSDFKYSYLYKNIKYYENSFMRIGINDKTGDLSFFSKNKNYHN